MRLANFLSFVECIVLIEKYLSTRKRFSKL